MAFTGDAAVRQALLPVLLVIAVIQPVSGVVFVLDGLLIGAGDGRYLAWAGIVTLAVYAPVALLLARWGFTWLWVAYGGVHAGSAGDLGPARAIPIAGWCSARAVTRPR